MTFSSWNMKMGLGTRNPHPFFSPKVLLCPQWTAHQILVVVFCTFPSHNSNNSHSESARICFFPVGVMPGPNCNKNPSRLHILLLLASLGLWMEALCLLSSESGLRQRNWKKNMESLNPDHVIGRYKPRAGSNQRHVRPSDSVIAPSFSPCQSCSVASR